MADNYAKIVQQNLDRLYGALPDDLAERLPARQEGKHLAFRAFGEECRIGPDGIELAGRPEMGPVGILISLYCLHVGVEPCILEPLKAYKELPGSTAYAGAFRVRTEAPLAACVPGIERSLAEITQTLDGHRPPGEPRGDFSLVAAPLPKVRLCYLFYRADEDFPASVTCLFSNNAPAFLPTDALADVGEYTTRKIRALLAPT